MKEKIILTLRDKKSARWAALIILSFTMFAGYMFTELISPLKPILESAYGWNSKDFGTVTSFYGFFNVWFFMLIIVGVLLDKFGIRFSTIGSVLIMIVGGTIKYLAFQLDFGGAVINFGFLGTMKTQIFIASMGYALFGVGVEYAGITVSKSVVKWFKGKEMALAMGMQVAIARMGSFVPLAFGALVASTKGVAATILIGVIFLIVGLVAFFYYNMQDKKLDKQLAKQKLESAEPDDDDGFKLSDLWVIFKSPGFWMIAILCVLFYSAVFPFYKYGPDLMVNKFGVTEKWAGLLPSLVPFGTMLLTPFFGGLYDKKGKGATIMIIGAILLVLVHVIFYLPFVNNVVFAFFNVIVLGIAFSLVPSAMWPSVPKIIPEKQLGSAYAAIFWVQNVGLWGIPLLVGVVLNSTNSTIAPDKSIVQESFNRAYTEVLEESKFKNAIIDNDGNKLNSDTLIIKKLAEGTAASIIFQTVRISEIDEVTIVDSTELSNEVYENTKKILTTYMNDSLVDSEMSALSKEKKFIGITTKKSKNIALEKLNSSLKIQVASVLKNKKVKLNYDYSTTWLIFIVLTLIALVVALFLKYLDKIKGYGLELPNIKQEEKDEKEEKE